MTLADIIPTGGEYASRVLHDLERIRKTEPPQDAVDVRSDAVARAAMDLVDACLQLSAKFPPEARASLTSTLPFTTLELELIRESLSVMHPTARQEIAARVDHWAAGDVLHFDGAAVEVKTFLTKLRPHLDSWNERAAVDEMLDRVILDR